MSVGGGGSPGGTRSSLKIIANIFISFIGAGVLGLPYAFKEAGILEGILIMTAVGICSVKAMLLIIECKYKILEHRKGRGRHYGRRSMNGHGDGLLPEDQHDLLKGEEQLVISVKDIPLQEKDLSYGDVGYEALGHTGKFLIDLAIVVSQTGFCCAYLIFISENLSDYFTGMTLVYWLMVLLPPLSIMSLLRHLNSLAITSLMAQCSNLMAFGVVFWFDFEHFSHIGMHPKEMSLKGFPFFLSIAIYCYEGAGMILSLESSMAEDLRYKFKRYFVSTMILVTSLYISFGAAGYLSFGPETNAIITLNLPKGESVDFSMIVKSFLCLALFCTYPVMMFPVTRILEKYFLHDPDKNIWKGNVLRAVMVLLTGLVVMLIPNFANLMALVGASCCTMLAFVLPAIFHWKIHAGTLTWRQKAVDIFLITLGVVGTIIGTLDALKRLGQVAHPPKPRRPHGKGPLLPPTPSNSSASASPPSLVSSATPPAAKPGALSSAKPTLTSVMTTKAVSSGSTPGPAGVTAGAAAAKTSVKAQLQVTESSSLLAKVLGSTTTAPSRTPSLTASTLAKARASLGPASASGNPQ